MHSHMPQHECGGQRATCRSHAVDSGIVRLGSWCVYSLNHLSNPTLHSPVWKGRMREITRKGHNGVKLYLMTFAWFCGTQWRGLWQVHGHPQAGQDSQNPRGSQGVTLPPWAVQCHRSTVPVSSVAGLCCARVLVCPSCPIAWKAVFCSPPLLSTTIQGFVQAHSGSVLFMRPWIWTFKAVGLSTRVCNYMFITAIMPLSFCALGLECSMATQALPDSVPSLCPLES